MYGPALEPISLPFRTIVGLCKALLVKPLNELLKRSKKTTQYVECFEAAASELVRYFSNHHEVSGLLLGEWRHIQKYKHHHPFFSRNHLIIIIRIILWALKPIRFALVKVAYSVGMLAGFSRRSAPETKLSEKTRETAVSLSELAAKLDLFTAYQMRRYA